MIGYIKSGGLLLGSTILFVFSLLLADYYRTCVVPMRFWNGIFLASIMFIAIIHLLDEWGKVSAEMLEKLVNLLVVVEVIIFLWGIGFMILLVFGSPTCIQPPVLLGYGLLMFVGTIISLKEGYSMLKRTIQ